MNDSLWLGFVTTASLEFLSVDGTIAGEKIMNRIPNFAEKLNEGRMLNLEGIVDGYVFLYKQSAHAWTFELDLRTSKEKW